jgi:hypothetical protein
VTTPAETQTLAALAAWAPLTALVADKITQDEIDEGDDLPAIIYERAETEPVATLVAPTDEARVTMRLTAWGKTRKSANAVAKAATDAMHAAGFPQQERSTAFEPELEEFATILTFEVWEI